MFIENPEVFKNWCTKILEPICDADPEALAKYVYALVKKDKPIDTLREEILDQLDVFLQNETKDFVDQLFNSLESNEYMKAFDNGNSTIRSKQDLIDSPLIDLKPLVDDEFNDIKLPSVSITPADTNLQFDRIKPIIQVSTLPNLSDTLIGDDKENLLQTDSDRSRTFRERGKTSSGSRHRLSRSRSKERTRRSRSRERKDARGIACTLSTNKLYKSRSPRRYEKRRSRSTSPLLSRYRSRSKSPRVMGHRGRYRNRSYSRSKSPSNECRGNLKRSRSPSPQSTDYNATDTQNLYNNDGKKKRCRDYETRGFCVRGDMCQFDHGVDAVVIANPSILGFGSNSHPGLTDDALMSTMILSNPQRFPVRLAPPEYNPTSPGMWQRNMFRTAPPRGPQQLLMNAPPPSFQSAAVVPGMIQRELINVPVLDNTAPVVSSTDSVSDTLLPPLIGPYQYPPPTSSQIHDSAPSVYKPMFYGQTGLVKKKNFDFNRLGPKKYSTNCSLELKKIPGLLNNISQLNNHFAKFGKIINIQVSYEGDPESALITFSSHNEANFAYKSTEPILNNRFIKVFWHKGNETKPDTLRPEENQQSTVLDEASSSKSENTTTINGMTTVPQTIVATETVTTTTASLTKPSDRLMKINNLKCTKKNLDEDKKDKEDPNKLRKDLHRRKQTLLEKQLEQQKLLISRMEKQDLSEAQRQTVMETIKTLHGSIDKLRKDLLAEISEQMALKGKTKEETQKEVLDVELELITKQKEGQDTTNLQKKLNQLKLQAGILLNRKPSTLPNTKFIKNCPPGAITKKPVRFPNRAALSKNNVNPKKAILPVTKRSKYVLQKNTIDNRPSKLLISGFELDDCDAVITHFKEFGPIEEHMIDLTTPSLIVHYKNRKDADTALCKGKTFEDRILSITWLSAVHAQLAHLKKLLQSSTKKIANDTKPDTTTIPKNESDSNVIETANVDTDVSIKQEPFDNVVSNVTIKTEIQPTVDGNHFLEDILLNDDDDVGSDHKSLKREYITK